MSKRGQESEPALSDAHRVGQETEAGAMKETYFSILGLPTVFDVDSNALHRAYIQLQQRYHPDRLARASEAEKLEAMQRSADANQAYMTLKDPLSRVKYLLGLQGIVLGDAKEAIKPSQALLMETMEWREALMEAQKDEALRALQTRLLARRDAVMAACAEFCAKAHYTAAAQEVLCWMFLQKTLQELQARIQALSS